MKASELIKHLEEGGTIENRTTSTIYTLDTVSSAIEGVLRYASNFKIVKKPRKNVVECYVSSLTHPNHEADHLSAFLGYDRWHQEETSNCKTKVRITVEEVLEEKD